MSSRALQKILRMIKFEHTLFALPLAYVGAILGVGGWPGFRISTLILLAMVGARSAAMSFNRLADYCYDLLNPRTKDRELPRGLLSRGSVISFMLASVLLFLSSALALGKWCFYLSPLALIVILGYSYTKRFTWACHIFLGLALSIAPVGGFLATTGRIDLPVLIMALGVLCWVAGFDVIYACQDVAFDAQMGLCSIPVHWGLGKALRISSLFHIAAFASFLLAGNLSGLSWPYFLGVLVVGLLMTWEHLIVGPGRLEMLDVAFFTANSYVSVTLLAGMVGAVLI